jgi:hypothetical protein
MKKVKYKVVDNTLTKEDLEVVQNLIMWNSEFPWFFRGDPVESGRKDSELSGCHLFSAGSTPIRLDKISLSDKAFDLQPLVDFLEVKSIIRIKGNFYPRTTEVEEHVPHYDYEFSHKGAIFSLNTCNGFTRLKDGTKIDSVENRMLLFDPSEYHNSSSCSDEKARFNINFNYF